MNGYKYAENIRVAHKDDLVVLASEESKSWVKISKECFKILNIVIEMNLIHSEILKIFELEEDRIYFDNLIQKLYDIDIITDKNYIKAKNIDNIYLVLTDRCNLSCTHCCANASGLNSNDELSTKEIYEIIDKVLKLDPEIITISGGEPLVIDDIWSIMEHLKSKFQGKVNLMTNGLLIDESNIQDIIKYFNNISISLDGIDEESCKIIRGNNVFKNIMKKIELLKANNFNNISTSAVLPNNEKIYQEFEKLNNDLGTEAMIRHFSYKGRAGFNYKKIEKQMNEYLKSRNMEENYILDWKKYIPDDKKYVMPGSCEGCESTLSIASNGDIYPCNLLMDSSYSIGNILEIDNIETYINNISKDSNEGYKTFIDLKQCNNEVCSNCSVKAFCWSCPAECDDLLSRKDIFTERCEQTKERLTSIVWG
ncbi:radical SAM protein [Romboutsia weinsteinii]|uniref:Radical SAM protein n=1 Tax=Romboutsia weinsteinii TaxID=2020949 RepID=A0A371J4C1_9FIRM|nr:radical SAM protein [Romboutsia weinsteinii]RDY27609.1 radical SAM protein [Romboutsia weinsteinii]